MAFWRKRITEHNEPMLGEVPQGVWAITNEPRGRSRKGDCKLGLPELTGDTVYRELDIPIHLGVRFSNLCTSSHLKQVQILPATLSVWIKEK